MEAKISRQLFLWICVWLVILGAAIATLGHLEMGTDKSLLLTYLGIPSQEAAEPLNVEPLYWAVLAILLAFTGLFLWLSLRASIKGLVAQPSGTATAVSDSPKKAPVPKAQDNKTRVQDDQRRALHLLCLLQREGRLVDFLEEDLTPYDDAQIGAAVRSIQENCQKSLKEYLALTAVIDQEEGEEFTVQAGFDTNAIKLTGKVIGEPPFKGILQHRGWQISTFALPALSGTQNPKIIAPAEVEIT